MTSAAIPSLQVPFPTLDETLALKPTAIALADLSPTAPQALIFLTSNPSNPLTPASLDLWSLTPNNTNPIHLPLTRPYTHFAIADLNGDSLPDLILADASTLAVRYALSPTTFAPEQLLLTTQSLRSLTTADLNADGKPDLILATSPATPNETAGILILFNTARPNADSTLTATPNPAPFEAPITLTATLPESPAPTGTVDFALDSTTLGLAPLITLTATLPESPAPTGTVDFALDSTTLGLAPLIAGTATLPIPAYTQGSATPPILPGTHRLLATYSDSTLSATLTISLGPPPASPSSPPPPTPAPYGSPVNGTFSVTVLDPHYPATGTYTVLDNGIAVPECTGLALTLPCPYGDPQILDAGPHSLSVAYNGGPQNGDPINASSASPPIGFTVTQDPVTTAALATSLNPASLHAPPSPSPPP